MSCFRVASRLLERQRVLLGVDLRQQLVLAHFELRAPDRALAERDLAVVVGARGALLGFALGDLLLEVLQLGALVERVLDLILAVEFDDQVARLTVLPGADQLGDDERVRVRPGETRGAAMVVDCTASTVPLSRTERTKSRRATV